MPSGYESPSNFIGLADVVRKALETSARREDKGDRWAPLIDALDADPSVPVNIGAGVRGDPMSRMFSTEVGTTAAKMVGNEDRTLKIIESLSVDVMAEAAKAPFVGILPTFNVHENMRLLYIGAAHGLPPTLLILDPDLALDETRRVTRPVVFPGVFATDFGEDPDSAQTADARVRSLFLRDSVSIATALAIAQPEVVVTRQPRMELQSVPSPLLSVSCGTETSTAGIYCRDGRGTLGLTACHHGTGPVNTAVSIGGIPSHVALADHLQDIVFLPLPTDARPSSLPGVKGVMTGRNPAQHSPARFEGATTGTQDTHVIAHDIGLGKNRPGVQQRVQTDPHTNRGDSGCALVDSDGWILGFAFQKTAFDDYPQFSDWIWASNALGSLDLTPA